MKFISAFALTIALLASLAVAEEKQNQNSKPDPADNSAEIWDSETWDNGSSTTFWRVVESTVSRAEADSTVCNNSSTSCLISGD